MYVQLWENLFQDKFLNGKYTPLFKKLIVLIQTLSNCAFGVAIIISIDSFVHGNGVWTACVVTMMSNIYHISI